MTTRLIVPALTLLAALEPATAFAGRPIAIPEPGSIGLFAAGIAAAVVALRFWKR